MTPISPKTALRAKKAVAVKGGVRGRNLTTSATVPHRGIHVSYSFTVYGNQEDRDGSPLGYHRTTQGSKWNPAARRYSDWKSYVVGAFLTACPEIKPTLGKPLTLLKGQTARIAIKVYWHNNKHCDLSNCLKGIEDALFTDDKNIDWLKAESKMAKDGKGKLEVIIQIS